MARRAKSEFFPVGSKPNPATNEWLLSGNATGSNGRFLPLRPKEWSRTSA